MFNPIFLVQVNLTFFIGGAGRCSSEPTEELFAGFRGAFRCLVEGGGDVAFVRHTTPFENTGTGTY